MKLQLVTPSVDVRATFALVCTDVGMPHVFSRGMSAKVATLHIPAKTEGKIVATVSAPPTIERPLSMPEHAHRLIYSNKAIILWTTEAGLLGLGIHTADEYQAV